MRDVATGIDTTIGIGTMTGIGTLTRIGAMTGIGTLTRIGALIGIGALIATGCAHAPADVHGYRLMNSGSGWTAKGQDRVFDDVRPRYPDFFAAVLDPARGDDPPTEALRDDLEKTPVDRANFDALNAVAIAYYEMNQRGERARELGDIEFMSAGYRAAKIVAVPWRAYMEIEDPSLRDAILDFFEDVGTGQKTDSARTRGRLARIVESLLEEEPDAARRARIERLTTELLATIPPLPGP